ncbi:unnamed protein product [Menidia menidia]|uniref:(Atlantic silverside) hypothetical protein n=1 Tax=Menidia menidia TaxID=238744 RepID=A0A8S4B5G9_9TELE|nr:unnamed protein product [Menidia menidia]
MSVWVTEEVIKRSLRFCCSRSLWQQRCFLVTASTPDSSFPGQTHARILDRRLNRLCPLGRHVTEIRFYSQGKNLSDELEGGNHFTPKLAVLPPSAEIKFDESDSEQKPGRSPFYDYLQSCHSPSDVLDLTCKYSPTIRQVSNCLTQMWSSTKKMSDDQRRCELRLMFEHPAFEKLMQKALSSVQHMRDDDLTYSLLSMVSLGVPQHSRVVQTYLRTCQDRLNDFDEKSLSILASCLEHMEDSPNVDALKEGLRLVVETHLPRIQNVMALQTMMRLLGKDSPKELKLKLEKKALSMTDQFSLPNAQYMISTMAAMGFHSKPLLHVCSQKIAENLHGIPFSRLYKVLQSCKVLLFRDLDLLVGISDYVASTLDIWSNKQLLLFLSVFEDLVFSPAALMTAFAERVIAKPGALTLKDLLCVLKVYSSLNFDLQHQREQFLESLSQALSCYLPKMSGMELLKGAYCLCLLGHFPPALLEGLLHSSALEQLEASKLPKSRERMLQTVSLCLRLDRPPLPQPLTVPPALLGNAPPVTWSMNSRLSQGLQSVLGGQSSSGLQEMVVVENFYLIDGLITKPLPAKTSETEASICTEETFSPAESSQRIAVIYGPNSSFCYGTSTPRGPLAVKIRHLKILGYTPVLVKERDLQPATEEERTDILRRLIFPEQHTSESLK